MCRFNLILLENEAGAEVLKEAGFQSFHISGSKYLAYQKGYCNCGSFVGELIGKKAMTYQEAVKADKKEKLERLYRIKAFMERADYPEIKARFMEKQQELSDELHTFHESIGSYEKQQAEEIRGKYSGDEYKREMESLFKEIADRMAALEEQPDYRSKKEIYCKFIEENEILNSSTIYYRTREEEESASIAGQRLAEMYGIQSEEAKALQEEYRVESLVIEEVIARAERKTNQSSLDEFKEYLDVFSKLLQKIPALGFATIWSELKDLKKVKTIGLGALKIDDLAFLEFDEMVWITRD